jgi:hypothetical protein
MFSIRKKRGKLFCTFGGQPPAEGVGVQLCTLQLILYFAKNCTLLKDEAGS